MAKVAQELGTPEFPRLLGIIPFPGKPCSWHYVFRRTPLVMRLSTSLTSSLSMGCRSQGRRSPKNAWGTGIQEAAVARFDELLAKWHLLGASEEETASNVRLHNLTNSLMLVRAVGVEPTRGITPQDPKSCAPASSATPAETEWWAMMVSNHRHPA